MTFQYLPALPPSDEMDRLKAVKGLSAVDPFWDPKSRELVRDAARQLGTCFAALSLFDRKHEIVRAGSGYSGGVIPRRESIGAHLMLGSGPMVILDTRDVSIHFLGSTTASVCMSMCIQIFMYDCILGLAI